MAFAPQMQPVCSSLINTHILHSASFAYLFAFLHDLDLLIPHVQHLLQDAGAAVQCCIFRLQAAHLLSQLLNLLMKVLDLGLRGVCATA